MTIPPLPEGSNIRMGMEQGKTVLSWMPPALPGIARFLPAAFLMFWLCGWAAGECFAIYALFQPAARTPWYVKLFLLVWLTLWTVGGVFAIGQVWILLRKPRPERLLLDGLELIHEAGTALGFKQGGDGAPTGLRRFFSRGEPVSFPRTEITAIGLHREDGARRLTIDRGVKRLEIGAGLSEPEQEWLAQVLKGWRGE